ncbi:MAG: extracellular solute-binding protein family 1 [Bryobacterales bacterium]|nr:extracellular solute-binding protein family 1 [Bryobacterales bacterium]
MLRDSQNRALSSRRTFLVAGGASTVACADRRPRLNVFNWSAYIDPAMIERFETERGVRIRYGTYESNEEMLARVMSGNSGWDVVFPTHSRLGPMATHGLLARLDHGRLPGLAGLDSRFQQPVWDSELHWAVPYMWNGTGVAYNSKLVAGVEAWSALWRDDLRGRMTMLDDPEDVLGVCLLKLGMPFSSVDERQLQAAKAEAIRQKQYLRAYLNADVRDQLVSGDVLAAELWSTTTAQAIAGNAALRFAWPTEGFPLYCDCAAILRESTRYELAHEFLEFLLQPDVAAANARVAVTATANRAGQSADPVLYPPGEVYARGFWPPALPPAAQRYRDRLWTEIKSA